MAISEKFAPWFLGNGYQDAGKIIFFEAPAIVLDLYKRQKRKYYIETNESHYLHAHHHEPFEVMRQVIQEQYPEYAPAFELVMKRTWAHMFNRCV